MKLYWFLMLDLTIVCCINDNSPLPIALIARAQVAEIQRSNPPGGNAKQCWAMQNKILKHSIEDMQSRSFHPTPVNPLILLVPFLNLPSKPSKDWVPLKKKQQESKKSKAIYFPSSCHHRLYFLHSLQPCISTSIYILYKAIYKAYIKVIRIHFPR